MPLIVIGWIVRALLRLGVGEARATAVATSAWLPRLLAALGVAGGLWLGGWWLTHLGGRWKEAEIARVWEARNQALAADNARLARERDEAKALVDARVREAIAAITVSADCTLPQDAVRRINAISGRARK